MKYTFTVVSEAEHNPEKEEEFKDALAKIVIHILRNKGKEPSQTK